MDDFPAFTKTAANRIAMNSHATPGVEGWVFEGAQGSQMTFWPCRGNASAAPHMHDFDEDMVVVRGCYTLALADRRVRLKPGEEYFIPKGTSHAGEAVAGTRTIHVFAGRRVERKEA
jgi:mannose-6-phosphate isomerase-like protein (cupin superfamily)